MSGKPEGVAFTIVVPGVIAPAAEAVRITFVEVRLTSGTRILPVSGSVGVALDAVKMPPSAAAVPKMPKGIMVRTMTKDKTALKMRLLLAILLFLLIKVC